MTACGPICLHCTEDRHYAVGTRDEHGSGLDRSELGLKPILAGAGLDRTAIFLKIGGTGLDRTEKIFFVSMLLF